MYFSNGKRSAVRSLLVAGLLALLIPSTTAKAQTAGCNPGGGTNARSVIFANRGTTAVEVKWLNFQCGETLYSTLRGGQEYSQATFVSHVWRFYEVGTGRLLKEERITDQARIEFGDAAVSAPTSTAAAGPPTTVAVAAAANPSPVFPASGDQRLREGLGGCTPGGGNDRRSVTFSNISSAQIEVWWVDFDCKERFFATMPAGSKYVQETYRSHLWRYYESPTGEASKALCAGSPIDASCLHPNDAGGGSVLYQTSVIAEQTNIDIGTPPAYDFKLQPKLQAKVSNTNTVVVSWAVPAGPVGSCYQIAFQVARGTVEQRKDNPCLVIPSVRPATMSVSVTLNASLLNKTRQSKKPLTYSAKVALVLDAAGTHSIPGVLVKSA
jgi:hypothetical protein